MFNLIVLIIMFGIAGTALLSGLVLYIRDQYNWYSQTKEMRRREEMADAEAREFRNL